NEAIANYLLIPDQLKDMDPDSTEWLTEINHLLSGVLEVGASLGRDNDFALTMFNLTEAMINPTTINLKLPLAYGNKETTDQVFSGFGSSLIVRASAVKLTEQFGASALGFIPGYTITLPDEVIEDGILKAGELESLIHTISLSANDFGEKAGIDTVGALVSNQSLNTYLTGFNNLEATTLNAIADNNLIRGLFSDALLAEPVQEYVRSTANGFVANLTLSDNFFAFRREDNKIDQTDFYELLKGVQAAQIQPDVFNDPSNGWINYLNGLLDSQLDQVFGSRIISEIIDFVVTDEGLHLFAADLVDTQYQGIQDQIAFLRNIEINFMDVFSRISEVKGDYDLFDTNEIKILIRSFQALNVNSQQELNSLSQIPNINEKLRETDAFETLFSSVRLHNAVSNIMKDEGPLKAIANAASTAVEDITKVEHEFKWQDFSFKQEKYGLFDYEKVKVLELKLFLIAATRYNWTTMGSPSMLNIQTVITNLYTEDELQTRPIDDIFASKLMIAIFDKALNFENNGLDLAPYAVEVGMKFLEGNATFKDLELSPDILYYDDSVYNANGVLTADSIKDMLRGYTLIDLSGPISFNTIYQTTQNGNFDEIFTSKIIHSLVSNVLSSQELRTFGQTKVNDFQSIFNMPETFLIFEKELRENEAEDGLIKVEELSNLIGSINTLGATTPSSLGSLGVDDVTNMLNRNIVDGEDDFDRFLKSGFIYMTIDKLMQHPNLGTTLGRVITDRLGIEEEAINTTPPVTVIGDVGIEQGRVTKQEMRQSLTSVSLLGLTGRPTQSNLGAELLLDLVDPNNPNDDMSILLQSDYVYVIMARQFEANYFSQFTKQMVEDIFGEPVSDINMGAPSDSKAVYAGESLITRTELRSLFVSTKLLGLTGVPSADSVSLNTILGLIGQNEDDGEDDLDRFLSSKYIADKFSKLLLSKTVREKIANDRYDYELIVLPESAMDNGRMANKEIYNVLNGLNILGINDFADVDFEIATVINLTDQEVDELLASTYLYVVIDLTMKEEDALDIPNHALVSSGDHLGRIEKAEIKKLIETAQYLDVEDLGSIDADDISLLDLRYIIEEIDSAIINRMISNSMIESLENEGILIPTAAYVDDVERKDLTNDELKKMVDALYHLNGDSYEGNINDILPISSDALNADLLQNLINVESVLIHRLISHHIIKEDLATPASYAVSGDDYFDSEAPDHDIKVTELELLVEAMHEIGGDLTNVEAETISIEKLEYIYGLNSTIINRVISTAMIESLTKDGQNNIPSTVYVDSERKDLDYIEMGHLIYSLRDLAGGDESKTIADLFPIDDALLTGTVLDSMVARESLIIYRIISSSIIDLNLHTDETYAVDGEDNYDEEAINQDIKIDEIKDLVAAVNTIGGNINDVDANNITIAMLQEIVDLDSRILDRIISNTIAESLDQKDVPSYAYRDGRPDLYHEEIEKMVLALERLAGADPNVLISEVLPIADTDLTKELMSDLVETESLIILRVISSGIISADIDTPESILAPDPDSANGGIDIKIAEIEHLIEVMNIFDITNVTTVEDEITIAKLKGLDETELNDILAEPNTIVYFVIDKIVQEALNNHDPLIMIGLIGTNKTTDDFIDNQVRIKREAMAEALAYL
ncbi:MAG: hypothetical protein WCY22_00965, partial [Acholeplasmataceae bacterium]